MIFSLCRRGGASLPQSPGAGGAELQNAAPEARRQKIDRS